MNSDNGSTPNPTPSTPAVGGNRPWRISKLVGDGKTRGFVITIEVDIPLDVASSAELAEALGGLTREAGTGLWTP